MDETRQQMELRHYREREALEERERAAAREAMVREREANAAAELLQNQASLDARVRALSPANLLSELAREGKSIRLMDDGAIAISPPDLNLIHRRVLETRRDDVIGLLRERQRVQLV